MKNPLRYVVLFFAVCTCAFAADYFFYRGKDSDVPLAVRWVRVIDHRGDNVRGAKITITLSGRSSVEGITDATGTVQFPKLEVARVEGVRCEVPAIGGSSYVTSIVADSRKIAWPVVFHLRPIRE